MISLSFLLCALSFIAQPKELSSPTLILKCQEGNSFNQACLVCSLLLGVGYDAYCVCGYAVREVTELDQRSKTCPLLQEREEVGAVSIASSLLYSYTRCVGFAPDERRRRGEEAVSLHGASSAKSEQPLREAAGGQGPG